MNSLELLIKHSHGDLVALKYQLSQYQQEIVRFNTSGRLYASYDETIAGLQLEIKRLESNK